MKTVIKTSMLTAALSFGLVACDGPKENAMEDAGQATTEAVEAQADAMEDAGQISDTQEEAMDDAGEAKADAMEEAGETADQADGTTTDPS